MTNTKLLVAHPEIEIKFSDIKDELRKDSDLYNIAKYGNAIEMDCAELTELRLRIKNSDESY